VLAVEAATRHAVDAMRENGRPFFIEALTYRFRAHSMYDADRYRDKNEVERWTREHDPIVLLRARLRAEGACDEATERQLEASVRAQLEAAVVEAEAGREESVTCLTDDVYTPRSR
jgi:pyruvate dehydrogenase E1 component alpha subunit